MVKKNIKDVLVQSGIFSDVQVGINLDMSFDKVEKETKVYSHNDGMDNGEITSKSEYTSDATGGQAAVPGTDSNNDTPTYVTQDGEITESSITDTDTVYAPNEEDTKTTNNGGVINYDV